MKCNKQIVGTRVIICAAGAGGDLFSYEVHIVADRTDHSHRGTELIVVQCQGHLAVARLWSDGVLQLSSQREARAARDAYSGKFPAVNFS